MSIEIKDSLNLPKTTFGMKAKLNELEPKLREMWEKQDLYGQLRTARKSAPKFILHCGPPYANGHFHVGHALSEGLKDFVVRSKSIMGYDAPLIPGWDCHGLPIEWKVEREQIKRGRNKDELTTAEIQQLCREEAKIWMSKQEEDWKSLGVSADFAGRYCTMDHQTEASITSQLLQLADSGYLYQGFKPVHWSVVEQTALAGAEVEYADITSPSIDLLFTITDEENTGVVIWTTTPWTLPANQAIAFNPTVKYSLINITAVQPEALIQPGLSVYIAHDLIADFCTRCHITEHTVIHTVTGDHFTDKMAQHPNEDRTVPFLPGDHVTTDQGTGFVHTAPSHGPDDFEIGLKYNLNLSCPVDARGCYLETVPTYAGMHIWKAEELIINDFAERKVLLQHSKIKHSYPVSWRSGKPLIFRTTKQWFLKIDHDELRTKAMDAVDNEITWHDDRIANQMHNLIKNRGDWCLSRQRAWGVPLAFFVNDADGTILNTQTSNEKIITEIAQNGVEIWQQLDAQKLNLSTSANYTKVNDVVDVWFDSGVSHRYVIADNPALPDQADLYLEGIDQCRGWFSSSLITSIALTGKPPYKQVLSHGFVVDGNGYKMSKSRGNVISPADIIAKYGTDILRMWLANSDTSEDVKISYPIMDNTAAQYRRLRNAFRYIIANLSDAPLELPVPTELPRLEQHILNRLHQVIAQVTSYYNEFKFMRAMHLISEFCNLELSAFYFDARKDCLYCDGKDSQTRRACQYVLRQLGTQLSIALSPIIPHTTEEIWQHLYPEVDSVHLQVLTRQEVWQKPELTQEWDELLKIRRIVDTELEQLRQAKKIGGNLDASVIISLPQNGNYQTISADLLKTICIVSELNIEYHHNDDITCQASPITSPKCDRCWHRAELIPYQGESAICSRCHQVIDAMLAT